MKKISYVVGLVAIAGTACDASAASRADRFRGEILNGLDIVAVRETIDIPEKDAAPGELGLEVYQTANAVVADDMQMFIPSSMYVRMGGGLNLGFATDYAHFGDDKYESSGSYTVQMGLGWNLSSYVRTEIDFQTMTLEFSDLNDYQATYRTLGGMLYFDFARRYIMTGDVTYRRRFVPFMGVGAGFGQYQFDGAGGADGFVIAAPRAALGFNIMLTDMIGLDVMYQYQMMIGNGFGWNAPATGVDNISNLMVSLRANF